MVNLILLEKVVIHRIILAVIEPVQLVVGVAELFLYFSRFLTWFRALLV